MTPYMLLEGQPTTEPVPQGWAIEPVGSWDGREAVVVYDARRYDVAVLPDGSDDDTHIVQDMRLCGWEPQMTGHALWQTRVNRRVIREGSWQECAHEALSAVAYALERRTTHAARSTSGPATRRRS